MRAFIFPGQGSQFVGMGEDIANASMVAYSTFQRIEDAIERSVFTIMSKGPAELLAMTEIAQPAIMANSIATLRVIELEGGVNLAEKVDFVAGHSLGEYSALCAAKAFDMETTAQLLQLRGKAMQAAVPLGRGAMAALLGADVERASALCAAAAEGDVCAVANDNDPSQVVISGHKDAIERAVALVKDYNIKRAVMLNVSAPFHCSLMQPAVDAMATALSHNPPAAPLMPLVANVTAAPTSDPESIATQLVEQVTGRVRWRESIANMAAAGVTEFVEIGGKVLTPMVKRIAPEANAISIVSMDDIEALVKGL
ncbi:MAG: ACP S-malonyltransferase [Sphingopyxis sp.]